MAGFIQSTIGSGTGTSVDANAFSTDPVAGNMIEVGVLVEATAATNTSVTDSAGNTYTSTTNVSAAAQSIKIWKAYNITSTVGLVVTVHNSSSVSTGIICHEFNGPGTSDPEDKFTSNTGSGTALDSGSTAALSQASEIVIGLGTVDNVDTLTTGSGYTNGVSTTSANFRFRMESKVVASTSAVNATLTANSSGNWEMLVATYKIQAPTSNVSVSDSITTSENNVEFIPFFAPRDTENITVSENVNLLLPLLRTNVSDSITVTATPIVNPSTITTSDTVFMSENVNVAVASQINVSTAISVAESLSATVTTGFRPDNYKNFAFSTLTNSPGTSGTVFTVQSGDGTLFPAARYNAVIWPVGTYYGPEAQALSTNAEIVRITAQQGDNLTVQRAQEGTTALNLTSGYAIEVRITAKTVTDIWTALGY